MTAANNNGGGTGFAGAEPMIPASGPNESPNGSGVPNVSNYFLMGPNQQNMGTIRTNTVSNGSVIGAASGTNSAQQQPVNGSGVYILQGMPKTRLGDMGTHNNNNSMGNQVAPSQTKYYVMS
ncbi:type VI secretion protein [Neisseriaceae bacterium PsAf]|nr:type VI secretion protein [Neisseriaceae bacterium PsAf]MCV2503560.1 DUF4150 domain-containing protein [Neisseriaceae bacterium]